MVKQLSVKMIKRIIKEELENVRRGRVSEAMSVTLQDAMTTLNKLDDLIADVIDLNPELEDKLRDAQNTILRALKSSAQHSDVEGFSTDKPRKMRGPGKTKMRSYGSQNEGRRVSRY